MKPEWHMVTITEPPLIMFIDLDKPPDRDGFPHSMASFMVDDYDATSRVEYIDEIRLLWILCFGRDEEFVRYATRKIIFRDSDMAVLADGWGIGDQAIGRFKESWLYEKARDRYAARQEPTP